MSDETILTDERVMHLWDTRVGEPCDKHPLTDTDKLHFARAIEQAVLQSPEIQGLIEDKKRLDWLESSPDSHGFCHAGFGDYIHYAHQIDGCPTVREVIDAAMEKQT